MAGLFDILFGGRGPRPMDEIPRDQFGNPLPIDQYGNYIGLPAGIVQGEWGPTGPGQGIPGTPRGLPGSPQLPGPPPTPPPPRPTLQIPNLPSAPVPPVRPQLKGWRGALQGIGNIAQDAIAGAATPNIAGGGPMDVLRSMAAAGDARNRRTLLDYNLQRQHALDEFGRQKTQYEMQREAAEQAQRQKYQDEQLAISREGRDIQRRNEARLEEMNRQANEDRDLAARDKFEKEMQAVGGREVGSSGFDLTPGTEKDYTVIKNRFGTWQVPTPAAQARTKQEETKRAEQVNWLSQADIDAALGAMGKGPKRQFHAPGTPEAQQYSAKRYPKEFADKLIDLAKSPKEDDTYWLNVATDPTATPAQRARAEDYLKRRTALTQAGRVNVNVGSVSADDPRVDEWHNLILQGKAKIADVPDKKVRDAIVVKYGGEALPAAYSGAAQTAISTAEAVLDQVKRLKAHFESGVDKNGKPLKDNNSWAYYGPDRVKYMAGLASDDDTAKTLADLNLSSIVGAARVLRGSSRAMPIFQKALEHTPNVWVDTPKLIYEKLLTIEQNLQDGITETKKYGSKTGVVQDGGTNPAATPQGGGNGYDPAFQQMLDQFKATLPRQ